MSHVRQKIREAAASLLATAPENWQRVFIQREAPTRAVMPYLLVYTPAEGAQPVTIHAPLLIRRDLTLIVSAHVRVADAETVEQTFDMVAAEIEKKLTQGALDGALGKIAGFTLINTQSDIVLNENSERLYGEIALTWQVQYHTKDGDAETFV